MFVRWFTLLRDADGGAGGGTGGGAAAAAPAAAGAGGSSSPAAAAPAAGGAGSPPAAAAPKGFADTLPADLREHASLKDIRDVDALARSYVNAQKLIGIPKDRLLVLPAEGDAAAEAELFTKLGRPEAPDKYGFKPPEGVTVDTKLQTSFAEKAHALGLTVKQANELYGWYNGMGAEAQAAARQQAAATMAATEAALKTEWGGAFDQNMELARGALAHYGDAKLSKELETTLQGNNPEILKLFAKLGQGLREDGLIGKGSPAAAALLSPTEAKQAINAMNADPETVKALTDKKHPKHAELLAKRTALYTQAYPTAA